MGASIDCVPWRCQQLGGEQTCFRRSRGTGGKQISFRTALHLRAPPECWVPSKPDVRVGTIMSIRERGTKEVRSEARAGHPRPPEVSQCCHFHPDPSGHILTPVLWTAALAWLPTANLCEGLQDVVRVCSSSLPLHVNTGRHQVTSRSHVSCACFLLNSALSLCPTLTCGRFHLGPPATSPRRQVRSPRTESTCPFCLARRRLNLLHGDLPTSVPVHPVSRSATTPAPAPTWQLLYLGH